MHASSGFLPGGYRPYAEVGPQRLSAGPPGTLTRLCFAAPTAVRLGRAADYEINAPPTHDRGRGRRPVCHEGGRRLGSRGTSVRRTVGQEYWVLGSRPLDMHQVSEVPP